MYPIFLLYGIFIFSAIFLVFILIAIMTDFAFLFFPQTPAKVLDKRIVITSARTSYLGDVHELFVKYHYEFKGITYTSTLLNAFGGVRRFGENGIRKVTAKAIISEDSLFVYVCPFYPKLAYALPFGWSKVSILPSIAVVLAVFVFSSSKLGIF
ncbi:hypothetical protein [Psychrobacter sp. NG27]|uniref:hypothetical protein n=1 Tax=Psychrobacter sp. NG27 TaxID=2781966 RepID=UPI0018DF38C5|nr:hypothetical protein [Psychrobacter sp. NG27]MBI0425670.1 hypothetical protein [Psychrobacter sp. NG27]